MENRIKTEKNEPVLIVPTICIQDTSEETPKKVLDPMKPAYNFNDSFVWETLSDICDIVISFQYMLNIDTIKAFS